MEYVVFLADMDEEGANKGITNGSGGVCLYLDMLPHKSYNECEQHKRDYAS
jgi:hypothetical protein